MVTFLLAVSLGAGWQLTFGPYVADYSRYLPRDTRESTTFRSTFLGSVIGSQCSMTLGALVASLPLVNGKGFLDNQVGFLGELAGGGLVAILIYLVIVVGKLTVNSLNAPSPLRTRRPRGSGRQGCTAVARSRWSACGSASWR
jgi:NCS1 family nucleobase:cation symporter-1